MKKQKLPDFIPDPPIDSREKVLSFERWFKSKYRRNATDDGWELIKR